MYREHSVAAVVPAHNEEAHIEEVIDTMPAFVDFIVIVDDASSDRTAEVAEASGDARVVVIRHEQNQGVGGAIIAAHTKAMELGADLDVVMAGDGQMDPKYLPSLLDPLIDDNYGFTKANRFFSIKSFEGMPRHRVWGSVALSFLTKLASGYWNLFDPQNGYTAIRRDVLERLPLERIARGYEFENDLLINLNILRVRALDVPIPARYGTEVSGMKLRSVAVSITNLLLRGFWRRVFWKYVLWSFSPIALFLFSGIALTAWGMVFGVWVVYEALQSTPSAGTVIVSVVPFMIGIQLLIYSLVLDIQEPPNR